MGVCFYLYFFGFAFLIVRKVKKTISETIRNQAPRMRMIDVIDKKYQEKTTALLEDVQHSMDLRGSFRLKNKTTKEFSQLLQK